MKRVNVSMPDDVFAAMEATRGDVSRSKWVLRSVQSRLAGAEFDQLAESSDPYDRRRAAKMYEEAQARVLESAPSETKGPGSREQATPGPVGSHETVAASSEEPVRVAAPTRAPEAGPEPDFELPKIAPRGWVQ